MIDEERASEWEQRALGILVRDHGTNEESAYVASALLAMITDWRNRNRCDETRVLHELQTVPEGEDRR